MMRKSTPFFKFFLLLAFQAFSCCLYSQATFVPNLGQWDGDFLYKTDLNNGALFFEENGYTALLTDPAISENRHNHSGSNQMGLPPHKHKEEYLNVAYNMTWVGSNPKKKVHPFSEMEFYHNYFLGKNKTRWKASVPVYKGLAYKELYEGISINYFQDKDNLKYDIHLAAGANPEVLKMNFEGLSSIGLNEGRLVLQTALGPVYEYIPEAYQIIDGQKITVPCNYTLHNNRVGFKLGSYNTSQPLIIDPILDFSTFSGATDDNWGFTATYDDLGDFYAGGIVEGQGYPATTGAFQVNFNAGKFDVAISKFSSDGKNLLYATFIGGSSIEMPHSMIVDDNRNLIILGSTSSKDFPINGAAYQDSLISGTPENWAPWNTKYSNGVNAFIIKLNAAGSAMIAGTFLGTNQGAVGTNLEILKNYCDETRGEVILLDNGNIAITTSSKSDNLPFLKPGAGPNGATQNAIVAVFNPALTQLIWGSYFGGNGNETGNSIKTNGTDLYICGATQSNNLPTTSNSFSSTYSGSIDGYIAKFNGSTGQFLGSTYIGTSSYDQAFFIDIDKFGSVLVFGQSQGNMPINNALYSNPGSHQFVQKYSADLSTQSWSTVVGSGQNKLDIVPSAFMVDKCLNIYISGWNGASNSNAGTFNLNNTLGLKTTTDAIDSTTDGSDFYFMVLDRDASDLLYATLYGGTADEHVDGGTSRFSADGTIYQAVCAGCGFIGSSFPTTPGAYSTTQNRQTNCNLGAVKISLEQTVKAAPSIDIRFDTDTTCEELIVRFSNTSKNANYYLWEFGNGLTSNQFEPTTTYSNLGTYTIKLIAFDTVCDISDTALLTLNHNLPKYPKATMAYNYAGCDKDFKVNFSSTSNEVNRFLWDFGDGNTSTQVNPTHYYSDTGTYRITLIAYDSICQLQDTVYATVTFTDSTVKPIAEVAYKECSSGEIAIFHQNLRDRFIYEWIYSGKKAMGAYPNISFEQPGIFAVSLRIEDTLCSQVYEQNFKVEIEAIQTEIYIPNAFSPNGDGINEQFELSGNRCNPNDYLRIFNRWGEIVFETNQPFSEFWDGTNDGKKPKEDVYTYLLKSGTQTRRGYLTLFM
jgi:gliding motility-associated-like protein